MLQIIKILYFNFAKDELTLGSTIHTCDSYTTHINCKSVHGTWFTTSWFLLQQYVFTKENNKRFIHSFIQFKSDSYTTCRV